MVTLISSLVGPSIGVAIKRLGGCWIFFLQTMVKTGQELDKNALEWSYTKTRYHNNHVCVFPLKMIVIFTHGWEVGVALIMLYNKL